VRVGLRLRRGDTVGVVSTGFAVEPGRLTRGVARLERLGFQVVVGRHALERQGYLAGNDDARAEDLLQMLAAPEIRAVWFARGGYGTARILDRVPWRSLARAPKLFVGYSDLTALFAPAIDRARSLCLYGPVVAELGDRSAWNVSSLVRLLAGRPFVLRVARRDVLAHGRARGRLIGGNLTVLAHLCGTRYEPDCRGSILFFEDAGEATYRIDRMLSQLRQAGWLAKLSGVVVGGLEVPPRRRFPPDRSLDDVLAEALVPLGVPVVRNVVAGHVRCKRTLPLGGTCEIDTRAGTLRMRP
jgi:muramoyltetrapeptide carboxypeptidase